MIHKVLIIKRNRNDKRYPYNEQFKGKKMTKQCTVCGEEGEEINWHYGAISCVACKVNNQKIYF